MTTGANVVPKPNLKPQRPQFSSGPTVKRPGWSAAALAEACLGRSHRSKQGKEAGRGAGSQPQDPGPAGGRIGIVPGSDTGAFEMAM